MMRPALARLLAAALRRRFRGEQARDLNAVLELRVRGPGGRAEVPVTVRIDRGRCTVVPGADSGAGAVATVGIEDLLRLARGRVGWPALLSSGRMQMTGDPFLALRVPTLFGMPASGRPGA